MSKEGETSTEQPRLCDLMLRGGCVMDGTGAPGVLADVAIIGDRIAAVGDLRQWQSRRDFDARNCVVAPGFIDVHTHDDHLLLSAPEMAAKTSQGVTTVVTGNCGVSLAPLVLQPQMPATFDLLGSRTAYRFPEFGDYRAELKRRPAAVNAACLIGHSTLRVGAMKDLGRPAEAHEVALMCEALARALRAGATGLSTGLYYEASRAAPTEEVIALAKVMSGGKGIYTTHMRDEGDGVETSLEETLRIGREADVPVLISHHKVIGPRNFGRSVQTLARIERALSEQKVALDVYPYIAGSTVLDPGRCDGRMRVMVTWSQPHPDQAGRDIADIAQGWGCSPVEAAERLQPAGAIYFMLHEDDVRRILAYPHSMIGSDGLPHDQHPHPRLWGAFPRVLGHYARDLGLLTLEEAVKRMTLLPARYFGFTDRGIIRRDAFADLVIFDPERIIDRATFENPTLPAEGIRLVIVNGEPVYRDGQALSARPGRMLCRDDGTQSAAVA